MNTADFLGGFATGLLVGMFCCLAALYAWRHTIEQWDLSLQYWRESDAANQQLMAEILAQTSAKAAK